MVVHYEAIRVGISELRLAPYVAAEGGDLGRALRLYAWNVEVSGAFLGILHLLEIRLRNALDEQLCRMYQRQDWWDAPDLRIHHIGRRAVVRAAQVVSARSGVITHGHMVAELSFGFWVGLLGRGGSCDYETRLWRPALRHAFPHYRGRRQPLYTDLDHIRTFRNHVAHHEPIHDRHLAADRLTIFRLLGWICPDFADWVTPLDRVPEVLSRRQDVVEGRLAPRF
ncbi:hypothetical protein ACN26Z_29010 [Verrucosispora sp. WMMD703]|uniref:hypothetical protein n=1 Tax=Verrucosispora sp. WMMD703 TaxID=3403463 RepID=UPI003B94A6C7